MENIKLLYEEKVMKERLNKSLILYIVSMVLMTLSGIAFAITIILRNDGKFDVVVLVPILLVLAIDLLLYVLIKSIKNLYKKYWNDPIGVEASFNEDHLWLRSYRGDDKISEVKHYYRELSYYSATEHYVFVFLANNTFFVLPKSDEVESFLLLKGVAKRK